MAATAIVMAFEDAEPAVYRWRRAHTTDGAEGMPAHVTLIYPFAEDSDLVTGQVSELRELLSAFPAFDVRFATFGRFDGPPPVLYLEPAPAHQLLRTTQVPPLPHAVPRLVVEQAAPLAGITVGQASHL